jgi:hypothetical protein
MDKDEEALVRSYAKLHKRKVSEIIRLAILERIEDEYDLKEFAQAKKEFELNPITRTQAEVEAMLGMNA